MDEERLRVVRTILHVQIIHFSEIDFLYLQFFFIVQLGKS